VTRFFASRAGRLVASAAIVALTTVTPTVRALASPLASSSVTQFNFSNTTQYYTVPSGVHQLGITVAGGSGGNGAQSVMIGSLGTGGLQW
jgi:hypothetical protein